MAKNICIVLGHPAPKSLCRSLAESYAEGARAAGANVRFIDPSSLNFDALADPRGKPALESSIVEAQGWIRESEHLVFVYPVWWGAAPSSLKSFIDSTFTTGFAYQYTTGGRWDKLLAGRTGQILVTMDAPSWFHRLVYRGSAVTWLRWAVLWFTGVKAQRTQEFCGVRDANAAKIAGWLAAARQLGQKAAAT